MPEDKLVNLGGSIEGFPKTPIVPDIPSPTPGGQPGNTKTFDDLWNEGMSTSKFAGKENIPLASFYTGSRFPESRPGTDPEEMAARQQDWTDKWGNSVAKFAGVTATTFVSGTAGLLWGIGAAATNWNFSSLIKNDVTDAMDKTMKDLEDYAPNYYTQNEKDADWLSSDNVLTANFWGDKMFKNLGYSLGSMGGGLAWSKLFKSIGLINSLVKTGKGLEAATAIESAMTNVPKVQKYAALENTVNTLGQKYIKNPLGSVLSDSDRILTSTMGTFGEASMEGLQNMNTFREKAIQDYRDKYGVSPSGADLEEINSYSQRIGNYTWGMNTLLLSATNYIQLPKILNSSRKAERAAINSIGQGEVGQNFSKMVYPNKALELYGKAKGVGRFLFSGTEAFEEGAQYAIQVGTDDYFNRAYNNKKELKTFLSTMNGVMNNIVKDGVEKTLGSKEGLESILIGGISGGMQQARGEFKEGGLFGDKGYRGKNTDLALQSINKTNINQVLTDQAKFMAIGLGSQKLRQEAILNNDKLSEKDYESDFALSYIMPRAKYGKADSIYTELSYYESQALKDGGFEELQTKGIANQTETRDQFLARIQSLKSTTKSIDNLYSTIQDKYLGQTTEEGKSKYSDQNIDSLVYAAGKINNYDARIPQVNSSLSTAGISTIDVLEGIIRDAKPNKEATQAAVAQINEMDVVDDIKTDLKRDLSDVIELSMRRKKFIKDYNAIVSDPTKGRTLGEFNLDTEDELFAAVEQEVVPEGKVKKKVVQKELEVGKQYSLKQPFLRKGNQLQLSPKIGIISKVLGGEFEVLLPSGETTFLSPEEFKQFDISDVSNESEGLTASMEKAIDTVLSSKKFQGIKKPDFASVEDKLNFVNSLDNTELTNAIESEFKIKSAEFIKQQASLQSKRERVLKRSEQIKNAQTQIGLSAGEVPTGSAIIDLEIGNSWEDMKKSWNRLFTSTIGDSIDWAIKQGRTIAPHVTYFNEFINNVKNFKNRDQVKAILITPNQEKALGLTGLSEMSFKSGGLNPEGATDPMNGFVGAVFIRIDKKGRKFFIDKNGDTIGEINGNPIDINKVVFSTMPQVDLYYSNKDPRFRKEQQKEAEQAAAWWEGERNKLFKAPENEYKIFDFGVSKGIPTVDKTHPEKNFVGEVIISEERIATQEGLIVVSTKGSIAHSDGSNYKFALGRPTIKYDDVLEFLFNSKIDKDKAQTIYKVLEKWSDELNDQLVNEQDVVVSPDYANFLNNILYWKADGPASKNKIFLDPEKDLLHIGDNTYSFADIRNSETQIYNNLQEIYHNVNNKTLALGLGVKFTELYLDKNNSIQKRLWPNYQSYLLSSKNPDGSSRTISSTPLYTNISKPTAAVPYAFKQKYAYLMGMDIGLQIVKKEEAPLEPVEVKGSALPNVVIVNNKEITLGGPVNSYPIGNFGSVDFVSTKEGVVNLVENANNSEVILNILLEEGEKMLSAIKDNLKAYNLYKEGLNSEQYIQIGIPTIISAKILSAQAAQKPAAPRPSTQGKEPVNGVQEVKFSNPNFKLEGFNIDGNYWNVVTSTDRAKTLVNINGVVVPFYLTTGQAGKGLIPGWYPFFGIGKDGWLNKTDKSDMETYYERYWGKETADLIKSASEELNSFYGTDPSAFKNDADPTTTVKPLTSLADKVEDYINSKLSYTPAINNADARKTLRSNVEQLGTEITNKVEAKPGAPVVQPEKPSQTTEVKNINLEDDDPEYRLVTAGDSSETITATEIELFKAYVAKNAPGIPYKFLDNLIYAANGKEAWGVFEKGVAKIFKGGLKGTEYHELFEGIWKGFLSEAQQILILNEFKENKGAFLDRESGRQIQYADATDKQAKERIADDFADYRLGKIKAKSLSQKILEFFKGIMDFFKSFVNKPSLKDQLFKAIDTGKFKKSVFPTSKINEAAEYKAVEGLNEQQTNDFIQDITVRIFNNVFSTNKSLFDIQNITASEIFESIKNKYIEIKVIGEGANQITEKTYSELQDRTKDFLKRFKIEFDEDSKVTINDEGSTNRNYAAEAFTVDFKKSSPYAVKLLIGTLVKTGGVSQESSSTLKLPKVDNTTSSIGGSMLIPFNRVFGTLINKLSNTRDIDTFVSKLYNLAKENSDYVRLFKRLGGDLESGKINFSEYEDYDWRLFISFYQVFSKQKPKFFMQYKDMDAVYSGDANQASIVKQVGQQWIENIKRKANDPESIISLRDKVYIVDKSSKDFPKESPKDPQDAIEFLNSLGINFSYDTFSKLRGAEQLENFANSVSGIYTSVSKSGELISLKRKSLDINNHINTLANLFVTINNPNEDSTFFNAENKRQQSITDSNALSYLESVFNSADTLDELLEKMPQLNDIFSKNSQVLKRGGLFFNADGDRIAEFKVEVISGIQDKSKNKGQSVSKLSQGERFTLEINRNVNGDYYVLVPADGATEWMMNLGNTIGFTEFVNDTANTAIQETFIGYLKDDIALAKDSKIRKRLNNVGDKAKELRFFKDILSKKMLEEIAKIVDDKKATDATIQTFIDDNIDEINNSVNDFINTTVEETKQILLSTKQVVVDKVGALKYPSLDSTFVTKFELNKNNLTEKQFTDVIKFANTNYIINNIEYHKVLFGDPYQFKITDKNGKVILDETKRIKSFLSPRRVTFDSPELNTFLNEKYNTVEGIKLTPKDFGYHEHKSFAKTFTAKDIIVRGSLSSMFPSYAETNEADAASWIMDGAYREVKVKNGQWSTDAEAFHQWQMAFTRLELDKKTNVNWSYGKNTALKEHDEKLVSKPVPQHVIEVLKPIVSGNKFNKKDINNVLDKFSQFPLYYSTVKNTNLEYLYLKMFDEKYDYVVVESGRKEGVEGLHSLYKPNGKFNDEAFNNTVEVPWNAYGIQVETSYEGEKLQTRGSQLTKLATLDLYEFGEPIGDTPERKKVIKDAVDKNKDILNKMHYNGYVQLLNKLGITDLEDGFGITNKTDVANTLRQEMLRRELSYNSIDSISLDPKTGEFMIPFEASTNYKQIKDILYSIVDKSISSPKMGGFSGVQVAATMWESTEGRKISIKRDGEYVNVTAQEYENASAEEKNSVVLTDDTLKFYTEKEPWCEVLLPNWFRKLVPNKFKTDAELIAYLNTVDGGKILSGIGFRIPTQALSSVESFRVKGFLEDYMGNTVVVPSEITTKSGSDFDIDKLNMYLKNVYVDASGDIRLVTSLDTEDATKAFYGRIFDIKNERQGFKKLELLEALQIKNLKLIDTKGLLVKYADVINTILEEAADSATAEEQIMTDLEKLADEDLQKELRAKYVNSMYTKSIENEYYASLEELVSLPENFERLVKPNDDDTLKSLASELEDLRGENESAIKNRILNRNYMTSLRHAFITAKRWVGIAAVNITGQSLYQKTQVYVKSKVSMALPHNTIIIDGTKHISLSGVYDSEGKFISDKLSMYANAFVDVAKDPYILKVIYSDRIVGTFMLMERAGVSMENTAMFLNQPIISEYIKYLDSKGLGRGAMYNDRNIDEIRSRFPAYPDTLYNATIELDKLKTNISDYAANKKLTDKQNGQQFLILDEFLTYSKLADANFAITQSINYDTASFRSADELARKQLRTEREQATNIIASPRNILENSSLGELAFFLDKATEALGEVLKFNQPAFRSILKDVIEEYAKNNYLAADKFSKISEKLSASFLDYIVQTKLPGGLDVKDLTTGVNSIANRIEDAKVLHPEIKMLQELQTVSSDLPGGPRTVKLQVNLKDAYDEDLFTGYMREMRDNPATADLYKDLVRLSISQGTYQSAVSIKNIVPLEDYAAIVAPVIAPLVVDNDLKNFAKNSMFQRNNFRDEDITPRINPDFEDIFGRYNTEPVALDIAEQEIFQYSSKMFPAVDTLGIVAEDKRVFLVDKWKIGAGSSLITIPTVITVKRGTEMVDFVTGRTITNYFYGQRKREGDYSLEKVFGYQLVKYKDGSPLIDANGKYVYKLVNLYGNGDLVSEYYTTPIPSVLDNNTAVIDNEIPDGDLIAYFAPVRLSKEEIVQDRISQKETLKPTQEVGKLGAIEIYNQLGTTTKTKNIIIKPWSVLKEATRAITPEGIISTRIKMTDAHFGNPFTSDKKLTNLIQVSTTKEAVQRYINWILTGETGEWVFTGIQPEELDSQREFILEKLKSGELKGKPILYYKELGEPSHATALDYLINNDNWVAQNVEQEYVETEENILDTNIPTIENPRVSIFELRENPIDYTAGQREALLDIENLINTKKQGYYLLAGYAGTGKTTIAENIALAARQAGKNVQVLAPTNKAAKVLNDKLKSKGVGSEATTIHKAIYGEPDPDTGEWTLSTPIKNSLVIIDEASMISKEIMNDLIDATQKNNILVFMGDSFQLEPVGEDSGLFVGKVEQVKDSKTELTEVKRQSLDSNVLKVATLVRMDGKAYVPSESMPDFKVTPSKNEFVSDFRKSVKNDEDSIMIVATNRERITMNNVARLEKYGANKSILEEGDKLISIANSSDLPNSETFDLKTLRGEPSKHSLTFTFNGVDEKQDVYFAYFVGKDNIERRMLFLPEVNRPSIYHAQMLKAMANSDRALYNSFDNGADIIKTKKGTKLSPAIVIATYGYAITAHKSQGSQWEKVFVNQDYSAPSWNAARWYYTAITRSAKEVNVFPTAINIKVNPAVIDSRIEGATTEDIPTTPVVQDTSAPVQVGDRTLKIDQYNITAKPDGKMFFQNGSEVTDQTIINKFNIRKELQEGTLRISQYNTANYFVLSDNKILGSGVTNLGKESVSDPKMKELILAKAVTYKTKC